MKKIKIYMVPNLLFCKLDIKRRFCIDGIIQTYIKK